MIPNIALHLLSHTLLFLLYLEVRPEEKPIHLLSTLDITTYFLSYFLLIRRYSYYRIRTDAEYTVMSGSHYSAQVMLRPSTTTPEPPSPSRLFTIPPEILAIILDGVERKDAFRLAQTCRHSMRNPEVLRAIFREPISIADIREWHRTWPEGRMDKITGPPVRWGINPSTGPLVRCMALPEWTSEQDIHYIITHCPNLDTVDFTEIVESVPNPIEEQSDDETSDDEEEESPESWPPFLDRYPALFQRLRSVSLYYGCWTFRYGRPERYRSNRMRVAMLPKCLSMAEHLQILTISCQPDSRPNRSPETRRESSAIILTGILSNVSKELTTLALYNTASTIDNLDRFMQALTVFPRLRTIKLSLHGDLLAYGKHFHRFYDLDGILGPILSSPKDYEHDTASVLQYLSVIKKIHERGRFSVVPTDKASGRRYLPCDFYGLSQEELVHGPRDHLWTPVWTWNDRLQWVTDQRSSLRVEKVDTGKCRALFEELIKAHMCVSVELEPIHVLNGAIFAADWIERSDSPGCIQGANVNRKNISSLSLRRPGRDRWDAGQHFVRRGSTGAILESSAASRRAPLAQTLTVGPLVVGNELSYTLPFRPATTAAPNDSANRNEQSQADADNSHTMDANTDIPNPVWRLNEIGDLVDDLRLILCQSFAYEYAKEYVGARRLKPGSPEYRKVMHNCRGPLRDRLWRESEYTALLFRRIPVDFPRLTRFALFIPAALYPNHDQTFINRVLPGTGWTVRHHEMPYEKVGDDLEPCWHIEERWLNLTNDICPFVRRIFTRPTPTDDPAAVVVHNDEWHVTTRPTFDLDGEYKSMEQLLTEPLRENYVFGTA